MQANSKPVISNQPGPHHRLVETVAKHARTEFLKPIAAYNRSAFNLSIAAWHAAGCLPLILDTGCGVGLSTLHLARQHPDHFVIGVDQSADRLARNTAWPYPTPSNCIHVRADMVDYWRLLHCEKISPAQQYMLYPNPWPKAEQLGRRWHGHPVFPTVVSLGGYIECRSNWRIYIEEFSAALAQLTGAPVECETYVAESPITPFEKKYKESGHALWRCKTKIALKHDCPSIVSI
jgi:tRNA (guanine-N7-)-methyltransferase